MPAVSSQTRLPRHPRNAINGARARELASARAYVARTHGYLVRFLTKIVARLYDNYQLKVTAVVDAPLPDARRSELCFIQYTPDAPRPVVAAIDLGGALAPVIDAVARTAAPARRLVVHLVSRARLPSAVVAPADTVPVAVHVYLAPPQ